MHTASQMRANRAITRQEAHYTRHARSSAYLDYAPTRLARASVSSSQDEVVVLASKRILRLLPRIHMVQFGPKRGLASAKNLQDKEKVSLSAADQQPTQCRRGKFLWRGCSQGALCFSIVSPSEELRTRLRHPLDQRLSLPKRFPHRRTIHLGRDWRFCPQSDQRRGLSAEAASGMKCREPKPNSRRIGLKTLRV